MILNIQFYYFLKRTKDNNFPRDNLFPYLCAIDENLVLGLLIMILTVTLISLQLPECRQEEICKEITDIPGEFLVNPICRCPGEMSCPSVAPKKVEVMVYDKKVCLETN